MDLPEDQIKASSIAAQISEAKNQMLRPLAYGEFAKGNFQETVFKVYVKYEKELKKSDALDFDDLLIKAVELLKNDKETLAKIQGRLAHTLVDEWQDTNKVQYTLTKLLVGENANFTVVGDASQSIYSWRGADYKNIVNLSKDFPQIKIINLERNYRSTQNILTAANSVISKNTHHTILKLWTQKGDGEKIKIYRAKNALDEASFIVSEVEKLTRKGSDFKDIAILYRTNAQSRTFEEALLHAGIPYTLIGGVRFYERTEIKDILSYMRLIANKNDSVAKKRIEKLGVTRTQKFYKLQEELKNIEKHTTLEIMDAIVSRTDYLAKFKRDTEENISRLENIRELRSVASEFPNIFDFLENVALIEAEQNSRYYFGNKDQANSVTLMTLHSAKGLEFPIVFLVGMEEGLFPHQRSLFDSYQLEEERRLAYVGMTRAKDILYLTFADRRLYFGQGNANPPSRFIADIPNDLLEVTGNYSPKERFYEF